MARYFGHKPGYAQRYDNPMSKGDLVPGGGKSYPSNYNKSGGGRYYRKTIDLGPGEYSRISPASEAMQDYQRYSRWARYNGMLKGFGTAASAFALADFMYAETAGWFVTLEPSKAFNVPAPWCGPNSFHPTFCLNPEYSSWGFIHQSGTVPNCTTRQETCGASTLSSSMPINAQAIVMSNSQLNVLNVGRAPSKRFISFQAPPQPIGHPASVPTRRVFQMLGQQGYPWPEPWRFREYGRSQRRPSRLNRPYQRTATTYNFPPGGGPPTKTPDPPHNQLPPPRGVREEKRAAKYGAAGRAYGFVTEVQDMSDCLVKALRAGGAKGPAPGRWNPARAWWIAKNAGFLNDDAMGAFVQCVASQEVGDSLMGAASRHIDRRFREGGYLGGLRGINGGRPSGFATGPHQDAIGDALRHAERIR